MHHRRGKWALIAATIVVVSVTSTLAGCGGDDGGSADAVGTWTHEEEGTISLEAGGEGEVVQSSDPVTFQWEQDGAMIAFYFGDERDEPDAQATLDGDSLTFRAGDFSGDEPVTFTRE